MDRERLLRMMRSERFEWDELLSKVPDYSITLPPPGYRHSPKDVIVHIAAYEGWVAERITAARAGRTTDLDVDRDGWRRYNDTLWGILLRRTVQEAREGAQRAFNEVVEAVDSLGDEDLVSRTPLVASLDVRWLGDGPLWQAIASDTFEHYRQHAALIEAAVSGTML